MNTVSKACARVIGRITAIAVEISQKHEMSVFVNYSGHCNLADLYIRKTKASDSPYLTHDFLYLNQWTPEQAEQKLNNMYENLRYILKTGKLPEGLPSVGYPYDGAVKLAWDRAVKLV